MSACQGSGEVEMSGWSTEDLGGSETTLYGLLVVGVSYIKTLSRHQTEPCNLWTLGGDDGSVWIHRL